jgi:hypothetical protein
MQRLLFFTLPLLLAAGPSPASTLAAASQQSASPPSSCPFPGSTSLPSSSPSSSPLNATTTPLDVPVWWADAVFREAARLEHMRGTAWTASIPPRPDRFVVLVEPRAHPLLAPVLALFMAQLAPRGWGLVLVHGTENEDYVRCCVRGWRTVHFRSLGEPDLSPPDHYSNTLTTRRFWEQLPGETYLMVQTDTFLRHPELDDFLSYEYVGSPWSPDVRARESSGALGGVWRGGRFPAEGGNGGLSLRTRSAMLRAIDVGVPRGDPRHPEDVFFVVSGAVTVAPREVGLRFGGESSLWVGAGPGIPAGLHKTFFYIDRSVVEPLLTVVPLDLEEEGADGWEEAARRLGTRPVGVAGVSAAPVQRSRAREEDEAVTISALGADKGAWADDGGEGVVGG